MSDTALFVGWGMTHPGREQFALKHYAEFVEILKQLKEEGQIERFEPFLLGPYAGELDGFILIHGEPEKLAGLLRREDLHRLEVQATHDHGKFSVIWARTGEALDREFSLFGETLSEYEHVPELV